jgi:hypothetical protein
MAHVAKGESDSHALGCQLSVASSHQGGQAGADLAMLEPVVGSQLSVVSKTAKPRRFGHVAQIKNCWLPVAACPGFSLAEHHQIVGCQLSSAGACQNAAHLTCTVGVQARCRCSAFVRTNGNGVHWCALACIGVQENGVLPLRAPHHFGRDEG